MPQENKTAPRPIDEPAMAHQNDVLEPKDEESWRCALEVVRDYRGDVTLNLQDGTQLIGFVFDIDWDAPGGWTVRLDTPEGAERHKVAADQIANIQLSGRDTAAGKSWENWVRRYAEKRLAGEEAGIECEPLDNTPPSST